MAITAVGTLASNTGALTLAVSPATIGNCLVVFIKVPSATATLTGISGGGCTSWLLLSGPVVDTNTTAHTHYFYRGVVTTTGASTITITLSAGTAADIDSQEFTAGSTAATWALDGTQSGFLNNATSTTIAYPSLTPSSTGLYVGHSRVPSGLSYTGPTGYVAQVDLNSNPYIYNTSVSATAAPTQGDTASSNSFSAAVIVVATVPAVMPPNYTAVGSLVSNTSTAATTGRSFAFTSVNVGDAVLLALETVSSTIQVSTVSGAGCVWTNLGVALDTDTAPSHDEWWMGIVTTPGAGTITITYTASVSGVQTDWDAMEFSSGYGAGGTWAAHRFASQTNASSSTLTWPTLATRMETVELYVGRGRVAGTPGTVTPASFTNIVDADVDPFIYSAVSGNISPTQPAGATSVTVGTAVMVYAYQLSVKSVSTSVVRASSF